MNDERWTKNKDIVLEKAFAFAVAVTNFVLEMQKQGEYVLSRQLLRSATSIWANIEEAKWWQSLKDFNAKMHIAKKESRETHYWLRVIASSQFWKFFDTSQLIHECEEIRKLLTSITKTTTYKLHISNRS